MKKEKRAQYFHKGKWVRFSALPKSEQKELRSKWATKAAKTRAKGRKRFSDLSPAEQHKKRSAWGRKGARARWERFSALPESEQEELRSEWTKKAAKTRAKDRKRFSDLSPAEQHKKRSAWAKKGARTRKRKAREAVKQKKQREERVRSLRKQAKRRPAKIPGKTKLARQTNLIRDALVRAKEAIDIAYPSIMLHFRVRRHGVGIWGTLSASGIPKSVSIREFLIFAESVVIEPKGCWVWITLLGDFAEEHYRPERGEKPGDEPPEENPYRRFQGFETIAVYPQKPGIGTPYMFLTAREIAQDLREQRKRRPEMIIFNVYWDESGKRPELKSSIARQAKHR